MTPWTLIGPLLAVITGLAGYFGYKAVRTFAPAWQAVPGFPGTLYQAPVDVTPARVAACLRHALDAFHVATGWKAEVVAALVPKLRIMVWPEESRMNSSGTTVAGQGNENGVDVGHSMLALAHEMGHWLEARTDGTVDAGHVGWGLNGIRAAEAAYEAWLKANPPGLMMLPGAKP
jgi:hypothetical protein